MICGHCGANVKQRRKNQRFCSRQCRDAYHNKIKMEAIRRFRKEIADEREKTVGA